MSSIASIASVVILPVQLADVELWPGTRFVKSGRLYFVVEDLKPLSSQTYTVRYGAQPLANPAPPSDLRIASSGGQVEIISSRVSAHLALGEKTYDPPVPAMDVPGPLAAGDSHLYRGANIKEWSAKPTDGGPVFARVETRYTLTLGIIACLLPDHPMAKDWSDYASAWLDHWLATEVGANGEWLCEGAHYGGQVSLTPLLAYAVAAKRAGFRDFTNDVRLKRLTSYFARQYTPRDPRRNDHRVTGERNGIVLKCQFTLPTPCCLSSGNVATRLVTSGPDCVAVPSFLPTAPPNILMASSQKARENTRTEIIHANQIFVFAVGNAALEFDFLPARGRRSGNQLTGT